jgi:hypothetical protein
MTGCCRRCDRAAEYVSAMSAPLCGRHAAAVIVRGGLVIPIEATEPLPEEDDISMAWANETA